MRMDAIHLEYSGRARLRPLRVCLVGFTFMLAVALASVAAGCGGSALEQVQLDSGPVIGSQVTNDGMDLWVFKGIPYAAPPVGDFRWRPPQPVAAWEEPRRCDEYGPSCPQPSAQGISYLAVGLTDEDCLYLNVWTPAESAGEALPVMVWIHGGSFETGSGSMAVYEGKNLAAMGVVVVTINYRLGPFGFLAHPALSAESSQGVSGNYGILDQIAALEWVKRNIGGFGGDPKNVTVFGESAGAISILDLLVSPLGRGLFHRAIAQSGILLDEGFGVSTTGTLEEAESRGVEFVGKLGIDPAEDVAARLRATSPDELVAAMDGMDTNLMDQGLMWKPVVDGIFLTDAPTDLWAAGERESMPLLIGSNLDEGNAFLQGLTISEKVFLEQMRRVFGDFADEALELYPVAGPDSITSAFSRMLTEVGFASTARLAARSMSGGSAGEQGGTSAASATAPAFLYQFTRVPLDNPLGAFHGVEIPYVFGNADLFSTLGAIEQADRDLSTAIMGYWTRFAATGDPNGADAASWPRYVPAGDQHLELGDAVRPGSGLYAEACDLADKARGLK